MWRCGICGWVGVCVCQCVIVHGCEVVGCGVLWWICVLVCKIHIMCVLMCLCWGHNMTQFD